MRSAAIHSGVSNVLPLHDVDDVLGDIGGVVANAFKVFGGKNQFKRGKHDTGIAHHVSKKLAEDLVTIVVNLIVAGQNLLRQFDIATHHGVKRIAHHFFGKLAHAWQIHVGLHAGV